MSDTALHLAAASPTRRRSLRDAIPLSAQSTLILLSIVVGLIASGSSLLGDPDTQWHIAVGRDIWAARAVPSTDLYSHTFFGAPWIAKEWLSQLILLGAYEAGAWRGVVLVTALSIGISFAILHEWLQRRLHPTLALAMTLAALPLAMPHMLARPHVLVLPVIVTWMIGITTALDRDRPPPLAFALVMTLWANMHGSFPLGLVMAGFAALESVAAAPRQQRVARFCRWALFLALALAGTALSPYGWNAILVPLRMEGNAETLQYVSEWKPLALDMTGVLALLALALSLAALVHGWRRNIFRITTVALLGLMMVRHSRFISLFGILTPILLTPALRRYPRFAPRAVGEPAALWGLAGALAAAAVVALVVVAPTPSPKVTPDAAYRAAVAAGVNGPVYNDYDFGGYLIAHGVKTFVDGRTDQLFLGDFMPGLMRALKSKSNADFAALLAKYHVTWALVRTGSKEVAHLSTMPGWTRIHSDDVATVFATAH